MSLPSVYGQENSITVNTDKTHYLEEDVISILGSVEQILFGEEVRLIVIAPNGDVVFIDSLTVDDNKQFQIEISTTSESTTSESLNDFGTYTVSARYGSENEVAEDTFSINQRNQYFYSNESKRNILLNFDFVNSDKKNIQEHIDYRITVSKNGVDVFGPTTFIHSATGSVSIPMTIVERQPHDVLIEVNGVMFQSMPVETATFKIVTGGETVLSEFTSKNSLKINLALDKNPSVDSKLIPAWVKNNAKWWAAEQIDDASFTQAIEYLITENIVAIPNLPYPADWQEKDIPSWVKYNAKWWAEDLIDEEDFIKGIKFLVEKGVIRINQV
jgi:hypothetical protein